MKKLTLLLVPALASVLLLTGCVDDGFYYGGGPAVYDYGNPYYTYGGLDYFYVGGRYFYRRGGHNIYVTSLPHGGYYRHGRSSYHRGVSYNHGSSRNTHVTTYRSSRVSTPHGNYRGSSHTSNVHVKKGNRHDDHNNH